MIIWKDLTEDLSKEHHVVLVDLPGHGKSGKPIGRYPPKRMAYAVMDVIKSLSLTGPILIGNSLGGATAIEVALLAPEKINAIALLGAPGGSQHPQFMRRMVGNLTHPNHIQSVSPHVVHLLWWMVAQTFNPVSAQTVDATWVQTRKSKQWPLFARAVSASLKELLIWNPPVEKISLPALVIQGATDIVVWPWLSDGLGQKIKGSQVARLSACGHFPQLQCLEKLVYVLKPFLARHSLVQRK
jgi:3-oxoadipate enol-lactonase